MRRGNMSLAELSDEIPSEPRVFRLPVLPPPATRAGCVDSPRPCLHMTCRHHMLHGEGSPAGRPSGAHLHKLSLDTMAETCSLDVADKGGVTLEEVAEILGLTRERVRQIEERAVSRLRGLANSYELDAWSPEELGEYQDPNISPGQCGRGGETEETQPDEDRWSLMADRAYRAYERRLQELARIPMQSEPDLPAQEEPMAGKPSEFRIVVRETYQRLVAEGNPQPTRNEVARALGLDEENSTLRRITVTLAHERLSGRIPKADRTVPRPWRRKEAAAHPAVPPPPPSAGPTGGDLPALLRERRSRLQAELGAIGVLLSDDGVEP